LTPLDTAINTAFTGNATLTTAFPGGLWPDLADAEAAMPYLVYTVLSGRLNQIVYGNKKHAKVYIRFQAIGPGKDATAVLADTFTGIFDDTVLTLSNGQNYACDRQQDPIPSLWQQRTGGAKDIWAYTVEYLYQTRT